MKYRQGNTNDLAAFKDLALKSWAIFENEMTTENWQKLSATLNSDQTYVQLLENSHSIVCEDENNAITGMAFLVPKGNPTEIYDESWCYIRFVSVDPAHAGQGIGRGLTEKCIEVAKTNNEQTIALHTSEMMNKARHIYERLGFTILKELDTRLGKRYWLYTLDIT